jgi:ribosomal protein S18 acetylase RimI-like enzyme
MFDRKGPTVDDGAGPCQSLTYHSLLVGGFLVRQAQPGDGLGIANVHLDTATTLRQLDDSRFKLPDTDGMGTWIDADLATMGEGWICFVAEEDGAIVGQVEAKVHAPLDSARYQTMSNLADIRGEVNSLGVLENHRRRGIARALMSAAEDWLKDHGARVVTLDTLMRSPESVPFYDSIGYERVSIIFERRLSLD